MDKVKTSEILITLIEDGEVYQVWTAYHPDFGLPSYAIYNKVYDVIEHFQPNFVNVMNVRDEFMNWWEARIKTKEQKAASSEAFDFGTPA